MAASAQTGPQSVTLSEGWTFRQERLDTSWHPATVPGTVHTDLMAIGAIEDPFFGLNERSVQWISKEDWLYENRFEVTAEQQQRVRRELTFYGLDTFAEVWLNDSLIIQANNMFRTWRADVTRLTRVGENTLRVRLALPVMPDLQTWDAFPNESSFIRKAPYHYGWDWGPRLVTMGIWRPVVFTAWDDAVIRDVFVEQQEVTRKCAVVRHHVTIEADHDQTVTISVADSASRRQLATQTVALRRGLNECVLPYTIRNPKLWWSNGLGEPHLYRLKTTVRPNRPTPDPSRQGGELGEEIRTTRVGLRSIQLHREKDAAGEAFYFTLNGERVFMKGANYIPSDVFLPRVSDSIYRRTIGDAVEANMNMVRVWGGGTYEDDRFYELCDERGILVWQDFMFACSMYPADPAFLENIRREAIDNVKRLRNHACIALWCGNNEVLDAWTNWGWRRRALQRGDGEAERIWGDYEAIFLKTLPEVVATYAPQTQYQSTSPYAAADGRRDYTKGDYHFWEVWHERKPVSEYNRARARFFSEYGMQSFPELASVKRFCPDPQEWSIGSEVMMAHQRGGAHANELIERYLSSEYGRPQAFDTLLYVGQLMQADAMKTAVEAHRRDKGYCWGSLVWQLNDCWPVASWSTRDYYGRWKAAHYAIRKAMADILVSPIQTEDGILHVYIVNDRLTPVSGKLTVEVWNSELRVKSEKLRVKSEECSKFKIQSSKLTVPANSSADVWQIPTAKLLAEASIAADEAVIHVEFCGYTNNYILVSPKDLKMGKGKVKWTMDNGQLTIITDHYARGVFLTIDGDPDHHFSDNYFDLLPGETRTVSVTTTLPPAELQRRLRVTSYRPF